MRNECCAPPIYGFSRMNQAGEKVSPHSYCFQEESSCSAATTDPYGSKGGRDQSEFLRTCEAMCERRTFGRRSIFQLEL